MALRDILNAFTGQNSNTASASGAYTYFSQPDGTGGVNYFKSPNEGTSSGQPIPITNQEYATATGEDTNKIEQEAAVAFEPPAPSGFTDVYANEIASGVRNPDGIMKTGTTGTTGTTGGIESNPQTLRGVNGEVIGNYDLAIPEDRTRYFNDKASYLANLRDQAVQELQSTTSKNLSEAQLSTDKTIASIDQDIADLQKEAQQYVQGYTKRVNQFGQDKNLGDVSRQQMFTKLSPNAFQSSQGTSQEFANTQYLQGLGDLATEANQNVGTDYLGNPTDATKLAAGSTFGRNYTGLLGQQNEVKNAFNTYKDTANQELTKGVQGYNQDYTSQVNEVGNAFASANKKQGIDPFQYSKIPLTQATAQTADISKYQPYTTFAGNAQQFSPTGVQMVQQPNAFTSGTPLENYMGTNKLDTTQTDYLRKYLLGQK
jgi:hypothetical protein